MVYLYSGTPGSGKSLHQAQEIYDCLRYRKNSLVVANYHINTANIKKCQGDFVYLDNTEMSPAKLIAISQQYFANNRFKEGAIKLYIDECQLIFNAREWNVKGRAEWLSFFTQHRKLGYDIYLIAQFDRMVDRQIRSLIEYEYIHRKVSNFGWGGKAFNFFAMGGLFVCVKVWYPLNQKIGSQWFKYHKKYASIYDSYAMLDDTPAVSAGERGTRTMRRVYGKHEKRNKITHMLRSLFVRPSHSDQTTASESHCSG